MTYEFWAKRADAGTYYQLIYSKATQGNVFFLNNKLTFDNDSSVVVQETGTTADTNWHYFAIARSGSGTGNTKLYKDGVDVTAEVTPAALLASNAVPLNLGRYNSTYGLYFNGSVDEVAVYPTALNAARVQAHFSAATTSTTGDPVTLDGAILRVDPDHRCGLRRQSVRRECRPEQATDHRLRTPEPVSLQAPPRHHRALGRDVGWNNWEEINRVANIGDATVENSRLALLRRCRPDGRHATSANPDICGNLYAAGSGAITARSHMRAWRQRRRR